VMGIRIVEVCPTTGSAPNVQKALPITATQAEIRRE
jgi:hypothetical protein